MIQTNLIFLFIAAIFIIGFFGNLIFRRTRISDIFFLLIIGFLLGSGLNIIPTPEISMLKNFAPFFGSLALIILMFEGGLHLNFYKVIKQLGRATGFTILVFILTNILSGVFLRFTFGIPWIYSLMIGAVIGGVSSAVVIPLIKESRAKENTKTMLTLESAITDALCVIIVITLVEVVIAKTTSIQFVIQSVFSAFAIATVIGAVAAVFWLRILRDFQYAREYGYLLTLSFLFLVFILIEFARGNGAFGALIFGLVLGNGPEILKMFKMKEFSISASITKFQSEISLFIKTFFFVYLGIIIDISTVDFRIVLIVVGLVVLALISRVLSIKMIFSKKHSQEDNKYVFALHARGLAAAVLATYPLTVGLNNEFTMLILPIAFLVIIITNLTTTIFFFFADRKSKLKVEEKEKTIKELIRVDDKVNPVVRDK